MPICKKICKALGIMVLGMSFGFAQTLPMPEMPSMPEMPEMPSMTSGFSGTFYRPTVPGQQNKKNNTDSSDSDSLSSNTVLTDANNTDDLISSILGLGANPNLTANDISTLYDSGLFSNLSSITNLVSASKTVANSGTSANKSNSEETVLLLKQILVSLEELKRSQNDFSQAERQTLTNYQQDNATFKKRTPSVLRFKINGYSITESFTKVFFSDLEADGSFLFTADRKYFANQKQLEETVYVLFKARKSNGSSVVYDVQPSIVQTNANDASFVYKFSQLKNLTAEKTGNLVVMHTNNNQITVDMLLDIDN